MKDFQDAPIVQKVYDYYRDLHLAVEKFPKKDKYSIGVKVETQTLDLIELIFEATNAGKSEKTRPLEKAGAKTDLIKLLIRLAYEIKAIDQKKYLSLEEQVQEIGKMIGGWLKYCKE